MKAYHRKATERLLAMDMSQAPEGNLIPRGALQPAGNATPLRPPALDGEASAPGVKEAPPGPCWAELDRSLDQWKHVTRSPIPRWQRLEVGEAQSVW
ncbi:hypothetical protein COCSUDRAFT_60961 [Coccomyxa subellipsoidea C-169]|uniref:Uncharacterized protein n=1 Tax=Coccomyxa subellipsoidea (strain C-169) TaxID=574566 RepID=I0Z5P7_COCSC|nr:hypothetical protein COCSUDRAFT_60959 [Coccomyxa subellipsoidea C-169]XP_005650510.1 hypothetical protein COCSUDRAFT_60961 [Coccomyxa subellipsoidea C-169]EIE25965.1 hypothetical protein COCSUDRAFT_60959 [Coccomyxa subellipsoidea C-169]EIE25966.1 hypothetical protein COCSUDRAFT_60961 [Coccomyxa subellipsoidea C-169]|eukprot:XP_005650509.1 hypothetical protein COCSUDRAFT_60959 [Coccomyxa subellipsoidea C-169]